MAAKKTQFLVEDLISKIFERRFPEGKLPPERAIAKIYEVSRYTVQKALARLEDMGLVQIRQGDGIYVQKNVQKYPMIYNSATQIHYSELHSHMIYLQKIPATQDLSSIFNINTGENVWEFKRIRVMNYTKAQVETGYIPCHLFPYMDKDIIEDSIQNYAMEMDYHISRFMTTYRPASLTSEEAELLNCKKAEPAFSLTSRGYLKDGRVFVYSKITAIHYECTYIVPFNKSVFIKRRDKR